MKLLILLLFTDAVALSQETPLLVLDFPPAAITNEDKPGMQRYRSNPVNLQCNFVSFDGQRLVDLVSALDRGVFAIEDSIVFVRFPAADPLTFIGTVFEGAEHHGPTGPFLWEGKIEGGGKYFASVVIEKGGRARAYFTTAVGMFRLSPATQPNRYFLCQRNPNFRR